MPAGGRLQQLVGPAVPRVEQIARTHELGGRAIAHLDVDREHSVEQKQPWAAGARRRPPSGIAVADPDLEHDHGRHLADDHAHAEVELLREVGIGVEEVAVRRSGPSSVALDLLLRSVGDHDAPVIISPPPSPSHQRPVGPRTRG